MSDMHNNLGPWYRQGNETKSAIAARLNYRVSSDKILDHRYLAFKHAS